MCAKKCSIHYLRHQLKKEISPWCTCMIFNFINYKIHFLHFHLWHSHFCTGCISFLLFCRNTRAQQSQNNIWHKTFKWTLNQKVQGVKWIMRIGKGMPPDEECCLFVFSYRGKNMTKMSQNCEIKEKTFANYYMELSLQTIITCKF